MTSMTNNSAMSEINDYYIVCSLSAAFGLMAIAISTMIMITVRRSKPRLHTVRHLLMCNTCIGSMLYCIVQAINYVFLIFLPWETSDIGCRWRGYFSYVSVSAATYSYFAQAISRLFFSVLSAKYKWLTTFKAHYILISIEWFIVIVAPSPAVITKDIYFRPGFICWVPVESTIHVAYTFFVYYFIPIFSILIIYIYIYKRVKKATKRAETILKTTNDKRDLEVLRNIVILLGIYIMGAVPTIFFLLTEIEVFYLISIVSFTLAVTIEKICTIFLDRELRQVVRKIVSWTSPVIPFDNTMTQARGQLNLTLS